MKIRRREFIIGAGAGAVPGTAIARNLGLTRGVTGISGGKPGAPSVPVAVTLSPTSSAIPDNALSGTALCSISVTMSDSSLFSGTLTQDGSFTSISGSSLTLSRNLTSGDDGSYTIHVTATQNGSSAASPYMLTVNPPTAPGSPFISATTIGTPRADSSDLFRGFRMVVGSNPLLVTALGRWVGPLNGSVHTHNLGIYYPDSTGHGVLMFGTGVTVDVSTGTPGTYKYVTLTSNVVLWPGQTYYVTSEEPAGGVGDIWYGTDTSVTTTADATMVGGATFDPSNNDLNDTSSGLHPMVPVNFQYSVQSYNFVMGSGFTQEREGQWFYAPNVQGPVSGSFTVGISIVYSPPASGTGLVEWVVWNGAGALVKRSGPITAPYPPSSGNWADWVFDTTTLPDGVYVYYPRFLDWSSQATYNFQADAGTIMIANHPPLSTGTQAIPFAAFSNHEIPSARPDFLTYTGTPNPTRNSYPLPYHFVAGSTSAALRNGGAWFGQTVGPKSYEYQVHPQWATTPSVGGVYVDYLESTLGNNSPGSYTGIISQNTFSGSRLNNLVSAFTTYVDDPAGGGVWWGAELGGRIFKQHNDGTIETIVGWERNMSLLTFPATAGSVPEGSITRNLIGTFTSPVDDLGGANDLCFDPRNSDVLYVVSQLDHFIAKVVISTKTVTLYAGSPGNAGYSGDGGAATSALFNNPSSIIMSDGTGNGGPAGTMYVADSVNSAIRKITPSGTISTLCGGSLSPGPVPSNSDMSATTTYNVTSMTWSGSTGTVVMAAATNIQLGFSITLAGSTSSGANGLYVVSAFTDSQHFNVVIAPAAPNLPSPSNGTFAGTMTFTSQNGDIYSSPGTVNFSGAGAGWFPFAYTIRFTSNNNICLAEIIPQTLRLLDLSANTAVRIGCYDDYLEVDGSQQWVWIGVNRAGTCGPVDDIIYQKFQDGIGGHGAHVTWRHSIDARWIGHTGYSSIFTNDSPSSVPTYGPIQNGIVSSFGHYGWAIHLSSTEGRMIGSGTAEFYATEAWIASTENFTLNQAIWDSGQYLTRSGTAQGFPLEVRPAFSSLWGAHGGPGFLINMSYEDLMNGSYASTTPGDAGDVALANFIRSGMGGGVPRPELTGNDMRDLIYFIRRGTLQGSVGTPVNPGATAADNAPPLFTAFSITRTNATTIHATWSTDKPTIGMVGAASNAQLPFNSYTINTDVESGYATTGHAMDLNVPSGLTPLNVQITAKDQAGNYSHTKPVSIA